MAHRTYRSRPQCKPGTHPPDSPTATSQHSPQMFGPIRVTGSLEIPSHGKLTNHGHHPLSPSTHCVDITQRGDEMARQLHLWVLPCKPMTQRLVRRLTGPEQLRGIELRADSVKSSVFQDAETLGRKSLETLEPGIPAVGTEGVSAAMTASRRPQAVGASDSPIAFWVMHFSTRVLK